LAPGLFSMNTFWPSTADILSATRRPTKSVGPPGGNATTMRTGRFGKSCAWASGAAPSAANAIQKTISTRRVIGTVSSDWAAVALVVPAQHSGRGACRHRNSAIPQA